MKLFLATILITFMAAIAQGQTMITGKVSNQKKEPLQSASIHIKESGTGTTTDSAGNFKIIVPEKGSKSLIISCVGYEPKSVLVHPEDAALQIVIILRDEAKVLGDVVVMSAGTFIASDKAKGASLTPMDAVTVAGTGGDVANSMRALPGVQQVGESEGLFVRGGTSDEAKQFIDGVAFPNPNYASVPGIMQPARVNPFLFKGILFNTGGYSALYGDALSSALILETVDLPEKSEASLHLFPTSQGLGFQHLAKNKQTSMGVTLNYSNAGIFYNKIVKQAAGYFHGPEYISSDFNFRVKTSKTGILKFYANYGYNNTGLGQADIDSIDLESSFQTKGNNLYSNLSYRESLRNNWKIDAAVSYNYSSQDIEKSLHNAENEKILINRYPFSEKNGSYTSKHNFLNSKVVLSKRFKGRQTLRFGAEYIHQDVTNSLSEPNVEGRSAYIEDATAMFAETDLQLNRKLAARIGLRSEQSSLLQQINITPRVSVAYKLSEKNQLSLAYGIFYQKPLSEYLLQNKRLNFSKATHYIINYQRNASNRFLRAELFYKAYKNLISTDSAIGNNGDGYAKGFELFFRDKRSVRDLDYWVSYSYLDTKRKFMNYPYQLNPTYATPHTFSLAVKRFFPALNFMANAAYWFTTGRPYYNIKTESDGRPVIQYSGTTKNYQSLNVSFAYLFNISKKWKDFSGIGFGMNNVLGTKQVFGYNFSYDGNNKTPVTLPATRFYYIGFFMSLGTDRRDDIINQNL
ncbi:TonB-dependent receptor [Niabella pedocola]|uniref:TonB-dependent receptor n=1 Tax=Niabella pedocola TaxID=1752077 RepID=A0ABS8PJF2_9BACT|nr:TonB-dependent receptor [Niabella pedocola]MCD2421228.1 TonB-dependent receptor [Niabella pedocola]